MSLSVACQNFRFVDWSVEVKRLISQHDVSEERSPFNPTDKNHVTPRPSTEIRVVFGKGLALHGSSPSLYIRPIALLVKLLLVSANYCWCQQTTTGVSKLLLMSANYYWCQQTTTGVSKLLLVSANYYWCQQTTTGVSKLLLVSANVILFLSVHQCHHITISTNTDKCKCHTTTPLTLYVTATCFNP